MKTFKIIVKDMTHCETIDGISSFVGEDESGSFGIQAGHVRFITSLVYGLARFRQGNGRWQYLAMPEAILYFINNELKLTTRRFILSDDYELISHTLVDILAREERELSELKRNLHNIETNILRRMLELGTLR